MLSFKTILFPIDFSDRARSAAQHVRAIATRFKSKVILLNVLENPTGYPGDLDFGALSTAMSVENRTESATDLLMKFAGEALDTINVEVRVEVGDPAGAIIRVAEEAHVDLIMMPTHGYGGFRRFILGSVTAKVLHDADCAVWTGIHLEDVAPANAPVRNIVCALDLTEASVLPLQLAVQLAQHHEATLTISHAVPGSDAIPERLMDMEFRQHLTADARKRIESLLAPTGATAGVCIESGDVHKVVSMCAKAHHADLVVIGRARTSGYGRLRTHSYAIIRESPCPVISL